MSKIKCLTVDREFIGQEWFGYLFSELILFRIRENLLVAKRFGISKKFRSPKPPNGRLGNYRISETEVSDRRELSSEEEPDFQGIITLWSSQPENLKNPIDFMPLFSYNWATDEIPLEIGRRAQG